MTNDIGTYEIIILDEDGNIIHHHYMFNSWRKMAEENAAKSCKFWHGSNWQVVKIS